MEQKRKIVPPVYLLSCLVLMAAMDRWLSLVPDLLASLQFLAPAWIVLGLVLIGFPALSFGRAGTGIVPFDPATTLVTSGFYRITRNPMYLGMVCILLGGALSFGSLGSLLPLPLFPWIIQKQFILGEERFLAAAFGDDYLVYKSRVRRWL